MFGSFLGQLMNNPQLMGLGELPASFDPMQAGAMPTLPGLGDPQMLAMQAGGVPDLMNPGAAVTSPLTSVDTRAPVPGPFDAGAGIPALAPAAMDPKQMMGLASMLQANDRQPPRSAPMGGGGLQRGQMSFGPAIPGARMIRR